MSGVRPTGPVPPFLQPLRRGANKLKELLDKGLIVPSEDIIPEKLPDGRYRLRLNPELQVPEAPRAVGLSITAHITGFLFILDAFSNPVCSIPSLDATVTHVFSNPTPGYNFAQDRVDLAGYSVLMTIGLTVNGRPAPYDFVLTLDASCDFETLGGWRVGDGGNFALGVPYHQETSLSVGNEGDTEYARTSTVIDVVAA